LCLLIIFVPFLLIYFQNARESDGGDYTCRAENDINTINQHVTVVVRGNDRFVRTNLYVMK